MDCAGCGKRFTLCETDGAATHLRLCATGHIHLVVGVHEEGGFDASGCQVIQCASCVDRVGRIVKCQCHSLRSRDERLIESLEKSWIGQMQCFCKDMQLPIKRQHLIHRLTQVGNPNVRAAEVL